MDPREDSTADERWQPIRQVGVCLDQSPFADRSMPHAVALAKAFGAKLTVLHALELPLERSTTTPTDPLEWEIQRTEARDHLAAIESEHATKDLAVGVEVLEGHPAEEIRNWVSSHHVDLTVLSSHGGSGWTEWSLASTARKLLEGISGSVLLVPAWSIQEAPKSEVTYERILVPLDGSPRAESALPAALSIARAHRSELLLLHVVPMPERSCPCPVSEADFDLEQRLLDRNKRAAETYLERVKRHIAASSVPVRTLVMVDGDVREEILRRVTEEHIDLIVISGHGRGGRAELPFGSVAGFLLEHATAPLLVMRDPTDHAARALSRSRNRVGPRLPNLAES